MKLNLISSKIKVGVFYLISNSSQIVFDQKLITLGSAASIAFIASEPFHQPFKPQAIAPRLTVAQKNIIHSGQLAAYIATLSPGLTLCILIEEYGLLFLPSQDVERN